MKRRKRWKTSGKRGRRLLAHLGLVAAVLGGLLATPVEAAPSTRDRIVGGSELGQGQRPYVAAIVVTRADGLQTLCAGALFKAQWVVTTTRCFDGLEPVVAVDVAFNTNPVKMTRGQTIVLGPHYNPDGSYFEQSAALIRVASSRGVAPIPIATDPAVTDRDRPVDIAGYGRVCSQCTGTKLVLRQARTQLVADDDVGAELEDLNYVDVPPTPRELERLMLTGGNGGVCIFDYGAPLMTPGRTSKLVGIGFGWIVRIGDPEECSGAPNGRHYVFAIDLVTSDIARWVPRAADPTSDRECGGRRASIRGTDKADIIVGTDGPDVITAGAGDDQISGLGGNDVICGGRGDDTIDSGSGNDRCNGGPGTDTAVGCERQSAIP